MARHLIHIINLHAWELKRSLINCMHKYNNILVLEFSTIIIFAIEDYILNYIFHACRLIIIQKCHMQPEGYFVISVGFCNINLAQDRRTYNNCGTDMIISHFQEIALN